MRQTAKLFMNGRSQAVRLPAEFRFDGNEVFIRKDEESGEVILSCKSASWNDFYKLADQAHVPGDFMEDRDNDMDEEKELF